MTVGGIGARFQMNTWAAYLADLSPSLLHAIARANRVSIPRGASPAIRLERLRTALCRAASVRATWATLDEPARELMRALARRPHGISAADLAAAGGLLRSPSALCRDPRPQSLSEQLLLLGWLLPRPAAPHHPPRYLVPPELRGWLPQPLALQGSGPVPAAPLPPVLQVAWAILLCCAATPLPIRADGRLRATALRQLARRLTGLPVASITAISHLLLPLLHGCGMLAPCGAAAALAPAARAFADRSTADQLALLREAWLAHPHPDPWAGALLLRDHGLDWPALRRRLCAWAEALPTEQLLDPTGLADALTAAYGPLADSTTHGLRPVPQTPWQAPRAAAIWQAALAGPLAWFGLIAWTADAALPGAQIYRTTTLPTQEPLRSMAPQTLYLPYGGISADLLDLMPFLEWQRSDSTGWLLALTPRSMARARAAGYAAHLLTSLLARVVGSLPADWGALPSPPDVQIVYRAVALSPDPELLHALGQDRTLTQEVGRIQLRPDVVALRVAGRLFHGQRGVSAPPSHELIADMKGTCIRAVATSIDQIAPDMQRYLAKGWGLWTSKLAEEVIGSGIEISLDAERGIFGQLQQVRGKLERATAVELHDLILRRAEVVRIAEETHQLLRRLRGVETETR